VVHDPDHVITRLDQFTNFECEDVDVLVTIRAAQEPLSSDLEPPFCQVANLDSIINVLGDVIKCGGLSREDTSGKFGDVLLDANVGHFNGYYCSDNNYGTFTSETRVFIHWEIPGSNDKGPMAFLKMIKKDFTFNPSNP
jgi:hypothetical protein